MLTVNFQSGMIKTFDAKSWNCEDGLLTIITKDSNLIYSQDLVDSIYFEKQVTDSGDLIPDTFDFGNGPVPAHQHPNGKGWVADTALVADTAFP